VRTETISYRFVTFVLRLGLVMGLVAAGWFVYNKLPHSGPGRNNNPPPGTSLQIVLQPGIGGAALDIPIEIYPIDIIAVRHEYFAERRAGKRFEDFLKERMNGRTPINARLDKQGQTIVVINPGNWWIHALVTGDADLEWRLPVSVGGSKQVVELNPQNAYTRAKSF
jgi:hypothetical protein